MTVHIFTQVSLYAVEFMQLLSSSFDPAEHIIIFRNSKNKERVDDISLNVLFVESRKDMILVLPPVLKSADILIFHSFPVSRSLLFWFRYRKLMHIAVWSVWGQDAYWYKYCSKTPQNLLYEWIRSLLIKKLKAILCPIRGDYDYIRKHYKTKAVHVEGMYPIPMDFNLLDRLRGMKKEGGVLNIQVGNSANPTNNHIEILDILGRHMDSDARVYCPLSYGDVNYQRRVIEHGNSVLGERFFPITTFMNKEEYGRYIAEMDILIMNHNRQQGLGNIFSYLYLGKKVYIRSDNTSFSFFINKGIGVYDTITLLKDIKTGTLRQIEPEKAETNMRMTQTLLLRDTLLRGWTELFRKP